MITMENRQLACILLTPPSRELRDHTHHSMTLESEHLGWPRQVVSGHHKSLIDHSPMVFHVCSSTKLFLQQSVQLSSDFQVTFFFSFLFVWLCAWCNFCLPRDGLLLSILLTPSLQCWDYRAALSCKTLLLFVFVWDKLTRSDGVKAGLPFGCVHPNSCAQWICSSREKTPTGVRKNSILDDAAGRNAVDKDPYEMEAEDGAATEEEVEEDSSSHL